MISYNIEPHAITSLTWPMWDACGIECPAMIGADRPGKDPRRYMDGPADAAHFRKSCPGWSAKFPSAAAEVVYGWTGTNDQDEECGNSVERTGWYGLFRNPDTSAHDGPMGAGVILCEAPSGAISMSRYGTTEELEKEWANLLDYTAEDTFECELCTQDTPDSEGHNVMHDDMQLTVCNQCYDPTEMEDTQ